MIDLKERELPEAIEANGKLFLIYTDFRVWLSFPDRVRDLKDGDWDGYKGLFSGVVPWPTEEVLGALGAFYNPPREIPRTDGSGEILLDVNVDADYIYSAFLQVYGIDLIDADMHWHKFSALLSGIPQGTMLMDIIGYRSYKGNGKDPEYKKYMRLKGLWALPQPVSEEEKEALEEFNRLFG